MPAYENQPTAKTAKPAFLPDKFWNDADQAPRLEDLARSYLELERRLGQAGGRVGNVPADPGQYQIEERHPMCGCDLEVNKRLHAAGFSNEQAQLVYDLAVERLLPTLQSLAGDLESQRHAEKLANHYGGPERFDEIKRQLKAWAKENLPQDVFAALSTTAEGVIALERMMAGGEPGIGLRGGEESGLPSDADLKQMVADPRYWKKRDPAYMAKVTEAFKRAYSGK